MRCPHATYAAPGARRRARRATRARFRPERSPPPGPTRSSTACVGEATTRGPPVASGSSTIPDVPADRSSSQTRKGTTSRTAATRLRPHCSHAATTTCRQWARRPVPLRLLRESAHCAWSRPAVRAAAPSSTAWRTIASIASLLTSACTRVTASVDSRSLRHEGVDARPRVTLAGARKCRGIFAAFAREQRHRIADRKPQDAQARDARRARAARARGRRLRAAGASPQKSGVTPSELQNARSASSTASGCSAIIACPPPASVTTRTSGSAVDERLRVLRRRHDVALRRRRRAPGSARGAAASARPRSDRTRRDRCRARPAPCAPSGAARCRSATRPAPGCRRAACRAL